MSENNITKLLRIFAEPFQELEDVFQTLKFERWIDTAIGEQLRLIGVLCGEPEPAGATDAIYRRRIKARIRTNRSSGLIEELLTIARLIHDDPAGHYRLEKVFHSTAVLHIEDVAITHEIAGIMIAFLRDATPGDQRVILEYGTSPPAEWFRFDSGPGFDQGKLNTSVE